MEDLLIGLCLYLWFSIKMNVKHYAENVILIIPTRCLLKLFMTLVSISAVFVFFLACSLSVRSLYKQQAQSPEEEMVYPEHPGVGRNSPLMQYAANVQHTPNSNIDADDESLLHNMDIQAEEEQSIFGGPMNTLETYKNPCWVGRLPEDDLTSIYKSNVYGLDSGYRSECKWGGGRDHCPLDFNYMINFVFQERVNSPSFSLPIPEGETTSRWRLRCMPLVYLVGVTKSGTTDLFDQVLAHTEVEEPSMKEPIWFNLKRIENPMSDAQVPFSDYVDLFDRAAENIRLKFILTKRGVLHNRVTVDGSPNYLWDYRGWQNIPGNQGLLEPRVTLAHALQRINPRAKIIVILRQPSARAYSQFVMQSGSRPELFHKRVTYILAEYQTCFEFNTIRACAYNNSIGFSIGKFNVRRIVQASLYSVYLRDWLSVFPRDQIHVIRSEDYYKDRQDSMREVFEFLEFGPTHKTSINAKINKKAANSRRYEPMFGVTKRLLDSFFQPFNQELALLLKDNRFLWQEQNSV